MMERLAFRGEWRRYQSLALEAFERDRGAGRTSTHLVAPPGSGKTLLGFESLRRLGSPALVLAPNSAIQAQGTRTGGVRGAARDGRGRAGSAGRVPDLPGAGAARRSGCGAAATGVSVRQMRGRSLRLDPDDPEKVASNWDVVCVAPRHAEGDRRLRPLRA